MWERMLTNSFQYCKKKIDLEKDDNPLEKDNNLLEKDNNPLENDHNPCNLSGCVFFLFSSRRH